VTRAGGALTWLVLVVLAFAPATAVPRHAAVQPLPEGPNALDLSARWPVLLDASTRLMASGAGERALPRAQRRPRGVVRRGAASCHRRSGGARRNRSLAELGRRQSDGG